jgi:hypothetical protein
MRSKRKILLTSIIFFSFLWVVIGDLVAMHINVIYDVNIYELQPFAKTQKSDEKTYKTNKGKTDSNSFSLDFVCEEYNSYSNLYLESVVIEFNSLDEFYPSNYTPQLPGRSPPIA